MSTTRRGVGAEIPSTAIGRPDGATAMTIPDLPGRINASDLVTTAGTIADLQLPSGMIQWYPGGHADPWNHVETAMALTTVGMTDHAERAYQWLVDIQLPNGAWHNYYLGDDIEDPKLDSNCVAYFATGIWHHYLATGDVGFVQRMWPTLERAVEFVLSMQNASGEVIWAKQLNESPWDYALLTGSSSIGHSLQCAIDAAAVTGQTRPEWIEARERLVNVIADKPEAFEPKDRWAMDWYYPVLTGAVVGRAATSRMTQSWDTFVMDGKGVRCVSDEPWVTAAETCECVMALLAVGDTDNAGNLFDWAQQLRADDGSYYTGMVFPQRVHFPENETSSYTAAAVILAADALYGKNPTSGLFTDHRLSDSA